MSATYLRVVENVRFMWPWAKNTGLRLSAGTCHKSMNMCFKQRYQTMLGLLQALRGNE